MFIGEGRVPFDTLVPFIPIQGSLHHPMYFTPKYKMATVIVERNARFLFEEENLDNSDDGDIPILTEGCNLYEARSSQK